MPDPLLLTVRSEIGAPQVTTSVKLLGEAELPRDNYPLYFDQVRSLLNFS